MPSKIPGGFILKARKTLNNSVLADGPPLYSKLWDWMLMQAFWKDGDKLKRGQFSTSTREMQEAVSWKVGYRKRLPTRQEIRSSYEAFTNNHMINHTKTTRGMVITICNYDIYQNPANYEQPTEQPDGHTTNNQVATHDREEGYKKEKKEKKLPSSFSRFWDVWQKKVDRTEAAQVWATLNPSEELIQKIVDNVTDRMASEDWSKEGRQYCPGPAKYLRKRKWEDEIPEAGEPGKIAGGKIVSWEEIQARQKEGERT